MREHGLRKHLDIEPCWNWTCRFDDRAVGVIGGRNCGPRGRIVRRAMGLRILCRREAGGLTPRACWSGGADENGQQDNGEVAHDHFSIAAHRHSLLLLLLLLRSLAFLRTFT